MVSSEDPGPRIWTRTAELVMFGRAEAMLMVCGVEKTLGSNLMLAAPTKIEFSRRKAFSDAVLESVTPALLRTSGLPPLLVSHYPAGPAWRQKVGALAHRTVTQARDVFDLHLLIASGQVDSARENATLSAALLKDAAHRCLAVGFETFKGQVLSYLTADQQPTYDDPDVWDAMVLKVADSLRGGHENA